MKHVHYDMIVAKAANMNLVTLIKDIDTGKWRQKLDQKGTSFNEEVEYFLCLPQHNEACLHWLNGGYVQVRYPERSWVNLDKYEDDTRWLSDADFMLDGCEIRIKPKKEKRFVVIHNGSLVNELFKMDADIRSSYGAEYSDLQIFEIEVEV